MTSVEVDPARCRGHARCLGVAPAAFDWDEEEDQAIPMPQDIIDTTDPAQLKRAEASCPEGAITLNRR